jgi:hypothetical protein
VAAKWPNSSQLRESEDAESCTTNRESRSEPDSMDLLYSKLNTLRRDHQRHSHQLNVGKEAPRLRIRSGCTSFVTNQTHMYGGLTIYWKCLNFPHSTEEN